MTRHFIFIFSWLLIASPVFAEQKTDRILDPTRLTEIAEAEMQATTTPGATIGIVHNGDLLWSKGLGLANVETEQPVTPDMLFRLGSTTKMFTAAALVSLAEEGKLSLHEPVGKCVTGLDPAIAALTPHQLLTHTAGLTDESIMSGRHDDAALGAGVRRFDARWLFTEPGRIYSYANPGFWIAGLACEEISQQSYADFLAERLFKPIGMERTTLRPTLAMTWPLALGHEVRGGKAAIVRPQADNAATWPAGQIYSSVTDLRRFVTAFMDGGKLDGRQALPAEVIDKLTRPYVVRPGDDSHYGYGLMVSTERGVRLWQHGGSRTGYGSTIRMAPDYKLAVIILTNKSASSLPKTAAAALEMLLPFDSSPPSAAPESQSLTETEMTDLAGSYTNHRQTIELSIADGLLHLRRSGGDDSQGASGTLEKTSDNRLAYRSDKVGPGTSTASYFIVRDDDNRPEYLISSGRAFKRTTSSP